MVEIKALNAPLNTAQIHQLVAMWRKSKRHALGDYVEPHDADSMAGFFEQVLQKEASNWIAWYEDQIVGFLSMQDVWLNQLYVDPAFIGGGIGQGFMEIAKTHCPDQISLYCFQRNENALKFYQKQGFEIKKSGEENEENLPDYLLIWKP